MRGEKIRELVDRSYVINAREKQMLVERISESTNYKEQFAGIASEVAQLQSGPLDRAALLDMRLRLEREGYAILKAPEESMGTNSSMVRCLMSSLRQLGPFLPQSKAGNLMHFVEPAENAPVHSFYSNSNIGGHIHTDGTFIHVPVPDYATLICVTPADQGGDSLLVDGRRVVDYLKRHYPEEIPFLLKHEFYFDTDEQVAAGGFIKRNILDLSGGAPRIQYFRALIALGHDKAGVPLTDEEGRILNIFDEAISAPENVTSHKLLRGEMLIINNNTHLHSREPFKPGAPGRAMPARLLLRVWTRLPPGSVVHH